MYGGSGDDVYVVDHLYDKTIETPADDAGPNGDTVFASVSWTLSARLENLELVGPTAFNGTGNGLGNRITGNDLANTLDGRIGADTLIGRGGNDLLEGGEGHDQLFGGLGRDVLYGGNGNDLVRGDIGNDRLFGGDGDDDLRGGDGNDVLRGGNGTDTLTGGDGADTFVFSTSLSADNVDLVTDFVSGSDRIALDTDAFAALGIDGEDGNRINYDFETGILSYDADAGGSGAGIAFARLTPQTQLTPDDFILI
ncbi:Poly(beta-D-mannuronate) C5 epimerase 1 [Methylobrevis pamukkalensis]|uniref:Poly(Beta-D-mannuronate) C5 epimerase 1 n=2 Tax=Methylobrevis pamukkalensis TaxID=1439726 RepID=A0A1E3H116_9HYPH|nr:Poly(beta-D-mannuronate) C5 epimerase 1 [Methylobrevis pamukkalensis]